LEGRSEHAPNHWNPTTTTCLYAGLWIFLRFNDYHLECPWLNKSFRMLSTSCASDPMNTLSSIQWAIWSTAESRRAVTESRIHLALGQDCTCTLLSHPASWWIFEKYIFHINGCTSLPRGCANML
jgi:hypothetical protein